MKRKFMSKLFLAARQMGELNHWPGKEDEAPYDIMRSEVAKWLSEQPDIREYICRKIMASGVIIFDSKKGSWIGRNGASPTLVRSKKEASVCGLSLEYAVKAVIESIETGKKLRTLEMQKYCFEERGVSRASFYRAIRVSKECGAIIQDKEGNWLSPACQDTPVQP